MSNLTDLTTIQPSPFILWYSQRIEQYAQRKGLSIPQAANHLNNIASFNARCQEIDSVVDPYYQTINKPQ